MINICWKSRTEVASFCQLVYQIKILTACGDATLVSMFRHHLKKPHVCYTQHAGSLSAVTLTGCMGALPCAPGHSGGRLLMERAALIGWVVLRAVTSLGGEALRCKITSPFMGGGGLCHSRREVSFIPFLAVSSVPFSCRCSNWPAWRLWKSFP